ncbi:MAG TPA: TetR/AcrR family transcriptional regulator [Kineosporiaceae bacterium]
MSSARAPRRRDDQGRRAELIQAAWRVIAREGIAATTTRRIAAEAGVPSGLVHYWFAGKDELLEAVVGEALKPIMATVSESSASDPHAGPFARLVSAFDVVRGDDWGHQLALYELTIWALRRPDLRELARRQYALYRRAGIEATTAWLREAGADPALPGDTLGELVAALFDGLVISWLADPEGTDADGALSLLARLAEGYVQASATTPQE